ncbi:DUF805 domain-containing protein [Frigoribacterium sp. CFBP9039]|uniref:DUF805 domain-containing protein n=1 Tax=Frigoribacterium sp. CFBP9029 TaxID=3096541 RepID=UPI002A6B7F9A|nr:DUF805 domain-containing protein [Frigoribacterium sp. CFBP9039]MDY0946187.1 DUF805 domain-containing protein [Frigoribacterium sp. CFBP9039]
MTDEQPQPYQPKPYEPQPEQPSAYQAPQPGEHGSATQGPPPLWAPYYDAPLTAAVSRFFRKFFDYSGRASRSEYWWFALVQGVVSFVLIMITGLVASIGSTVDASGQAVSDPPLAIFVPLVILNFVLWLVLLVGTLSLTARRLHDVGLSGFFQFLYLVPFGSIAVFVMTLLAPKPEGARFDKPRD